MQQCTLTYTVYTFSPLVKNFLVLARVPCDSNSSRPLFALPLCSSRALIVCILGREGGRGKIERISGGEWRGKIERISGVEWRGNRDGY